MTRNPGHSIIGAAWLAATLLAGGSAYADACNPDMLARLPPNKRAVIEKRCTARAAQAGYEISNQGSVAEEPTPPDLYAGDDKASLEKMIRDAWARAYPKDEIMGVRFSMQDWKRDVKKVWDQASKSYSLRDKSVLAVRVVVKTSAEAATIFPAYINRDNLSGSLKPGVATKTREHVVKQMLVANYQT